MTEGGVIGGVGDSGTVLVLLLLLLRYEGSWPRLDEPASCHVLLAAQAVEELSW